MSKKPDEAKKSLDETQIESSATEVGRRTAMKALGATVLAAGATSTAGCFVAAQPARGYSTGMTDGDAGSYADPAGGGRGGPRNVATGFTDSDNAATGAMQDAPGYGRGHHGNANWRSGLTDSDGGAYADPAGNGRGTARMGNTGLTDSDGGAYADPAGRGRGRWR